MAAPGSSRRAVLKHLAALAGLGAGASAGPWPSPALWAQRGGAAAAGSGGARGAGPVQAATGATLILLGTQGGPGLNLSRGEAASVVLVDGRPYLIDCGYGAVRGLLQAGIRLVDVGHLFVTHLHDDHTSDIAAFLTHKWTNGNASPQRADVYGPHGTEAMVAGAIAFFKGNTDIRMVDEGRTVRPESIFAGHDVNAPAATQVFRDERITVLAAENAHFPDRARARMPYRSFAYRVNTRTRSFVFSGDTAYSIGLIDLARGADVLVCEAMSMAARRQREADRDNAGPGESIARHVLETHVTTEDVGRMAAEAKVKTVVLNHLLGAPAAGAAGAAADGLTADVRKYFDGEVIVGADQMRI
jgi:ribonuclease BN (tRNA processing enzyme)